MKCELFRIGRQRAFGLKESCRRKLAKKGHFKDALCARSGLDWLVGLAPNISVLMISRDSDERENSQACHTIGGLIFPPL